VSNRRRHLAYVLPLALGVGAATALVTLVYLSGPSVLIPAGTTEIVPAYLNGTAQEGGLAICQQHHDCGQAGSVQISFVLSGPAALTGTLELPAPLVVALGNPTGVGELRCDLAWPPSDCTSVEGAELYESAPLNGTVNLGDLPFALLGANNLVPAGTWTLCLVNWGLSPVDVTVTAAVIASPR
jgi:hypothetical protein